MANATKPVKPLLLYDGGCGFCRCAAQRWRKRSEGIVDVASSQSGAGEAYGFEEGEPLCAVQLIECDGRVCSGAEAVLLFMSLCGSGPGRLGWHLLKRFPVLRSVMELGYRIVGRHRPLFARLFGCSERLALEEHPTRNS